MQTRTRSKAAALSGSSSMLPPLPEPVQVLILDRLLVSYPEPDAVDYMIYPFKSTLGWLLSLRLVNRQWSHHIKQHATVAARCRLESLRNLTLLHDYAHIIVTAATYKAKSRSTKVPKKITLNFTDIDGSHCEFTVPRALSKAESAGGLPSHTLMLVASYDAITLPALQQLLADLDCLDQRHAAAMVLKLLTARSCPAPSTAAAAAAAAAPHRPHGIDAAGSPARGSSRSGLAAASSQAARQAHTAPSGELATLSSSAAVVDATAPPSNKSAAGSVQQLIAAVAPLLQQRLVHVVIEGSAASPALYFIPTRNGFCRRLPAGDGAGAVRRLGDI